MIYPHTRVVVAAFGLVLVAESAAFAQPTPGQASPVAAVKALPFVSPIFGDNMVLQRGKADAIWGWSDAGDNVRVQIGEKTATGVAGPDHRWQVKIEPPAKDADTEIKATNHPEIRFFTVAGRPAYHHVDVIDGKWQVVSPETASWVSAVGYYFARRVQKDAHVPIGLVVDAVGGTPAESWTSEDALRPLHDFDVPLAELDRLKAANGPEYGNYVMHWYDQYDAGQKNHWAAPDYEDSDWKSVPVPGGFAELGVPDSPALVWFRKEVTLPDPLPQAAAQAMSLTHHVRSS
jgi:sialate O-acetylesterase